MTNLRKPGRYAQDEVEIGRYDYDEFDEEEPDEEEIFLIPFWREVYRDIRNGVAALAAFVALLLFWKGPNHVFGIIERIIALWR